MNPDDAIELVKLLDALRAHEGDSVTFYSDNPDFSGSDHPNCIIEACGAWTNWGTHGFGGDTVLDALRAANKAMEQAKQG